MARDCEYGFNHSVALTTRFCCLTTVAYPLGGHNVRGSSFASKVEKGAKASFSDKINFDVNSLLLGLYKVFQSAAFLIFYLFTGMSVCQWKSIQ